MIVTKQLNGSYLISDIVNGYWIKQVYYFYTTREAMKLFREYRKQLKNE